MRNAIFLCYQKGPCSRCMPWIQTSCLEYVPLLCLAMHSDLQDGHAWEVKVCRKLQGAPGSLTGQATVHKFQKNAFYNEVTSIGVRA